MSKYQCGLERAVQFTNSCSRWLCFLFFLLIIILVWLALSFHEKLMTYCVWNFGLENDTAFASYFSCNSWCLFYYFWHSRVGLLWQVLMNCYFFEQMTTAIAIEDVRREVKILKSLSGHKHLVQFYDACEDSNNVYVVMEYVFFLKLELLLCN